MNVGRGVWLLALLSLTACAPPQISVEIPFEARIDGAKAQCEAALDGLVMTDLRFYVAGVMLRRSDGADVPLRMTEHGRWQQADIALIDLEDGSGVCENGTPDMNSVIKGQIREGDYVGMSFELSVPFDRNHADPLSASAPLDDTTMHWHWRSGYKFLRAGVRTEDDGYWVHLGSAGCEGTVQDITGCRFPNRVPVNLTDYRPGDTVVAELSFLSAAADLGDGEATDCASGPADAACGPVFAQLGLDHESGTISGHQQLFAIGSQ